MANYRILLVFPISKQELEKETRYKLEEKLFEGISPQQNWVTIDWAKNEAEALAHCKETSYAVVICYLHLPVDSKTPLREEEKRGLSFLRLIKADMPRIPVILVVTAMDCKLYDAIKGYQECIAIQEGEKFDESLMEQCKKFLTVCHFRKKTALIDITINFESSSSIVGKYQIKGSGIDIPGDIYLNSRTLRNFITDSEELEAAIGKKDWTVEDWEKKFRRLGLDLSEEIFRDWKFMATIRDVEQEVGGFENIRIRFILNEACHTIIFEALMDHGQNLFILKAPMYRRIPYTISTGLTPLFMEENANGGSINCLIIGADAQGYVEGLSGQGQDLEKLPNLAKEISWVEQHLQGIVKGTVKVLARKTIPPKKTFKEQLLQLLSNGTWDLVHFAGHTLYSKDEKGNNIGCLALPKGKRSELMAISDLAHYLRAAKTRFLYLNSCHSTSAAMVFKLAEQQIPAIIGFRWPILDDQALSYAQSFYENLFDGRSLEESFFHTRKAMHQKYKDPRSSAALLLILQTP